MENLSVSYKKKCIWHLLIRAFAGLGIWEVYLYEIMKTTQYNPGNCVGRNRYYIGISNISK